MCPETVLLSACAAVNSSSRARKPTNPTQDATVRGLQHAANLAYQSTVAYSEVQRARSPTLAVFQNTRYGSVMHTSLTRHLSCLKFNNQLIKQLSPMPLFVQHLNDITLHSQGHLDLHAPCHDLPTVLSAVQSVLYDFKVTLHMSSRLTILLAVSTQ